MRFLWIYLAVYAALILGAVLALWQGGVLAYLSPLTIVVTLAVVLVLGILLAVVWRWRPSRA